MLSKFQIVLQNGETSCAVNNNPHSHSHTPEQAGSTEIDSTTPQADHNLVEPMKHNELSVKDFDAFGNRCERLNSSSSLLSDDSSDSDEPRAEIKDDQILI